MYLGFWRPVALKPAPLLGVGRKCALELSNSGLTVIVWIAMGWNSSFLGGPGVYEMIPGFLLAMLAIVVVSLATNAKGEFRAIGSK